MSLDRRIRAVLARIVRSNGGEAVAALAALERLLPANVSLADVLFVGLHHSRQDLVDPSLVAENQRLALELDVTAGRLATASERIARLEQGIEEACRALSEAGARLKAERAEQADQSGESGKRSA